MFIVTWARTRAVWLKDSLRTTPVGCRFNFERLELCSGEMVSALHVYSLGKCHPSLKEKKKTYFADTKFGSSVKRTKCFVFAAPFIKYFSFVWSKTLCNLTAKRAMQCLGIKWLEADSNKHLYFSPPSVEKSFKTLSIKVWRTKTKR